MKNTKITQQTLEALNKTDDSLVIVDIRLPKDYEHSHIANAINIPLLSARKASEKFSQIPKDKNIVVVCYIGVWAGKTVKLLAEERPSIRSLDGGMGSWMGTVVSDTARPSRNLAKALFVMASILLIANALCAHFFGVWWSVGFSLVVAAILLLDTMTINYLGRQLRGFGFR
jgi:rhodanese-related sulfurtransferase